MTAGGHDLILLYTLFKNYLLLFCYNLISISAKLLLNKKIKPHILVPSEYFLYTLLVCVAVGRVNYVGCIYLERPTLFQKHCPY